MKTKTAFALAAAFAAGLALAPADAAAQIDTRRDNGGWSNRDRNRDRDVDRDWNWDRDRDRRGASVESLAKRAERESNSFRDWFEDNYRNRRLGRERDNRWLKSEIQNLDEALEHVRSRADDRRPTRGRADMEDALDHARRIDRELIVDNDRDTRFTVRPWVELRLTLDRLARVYGVRRF